MLLMYSTHANIKTAFKLKYEHDEFDDEIEWFGLSGQAHVHCQIIL